MFISSSPPLHLHENWQTERTNAEHNFATISNVHTTKHVCLCLFIIAVLKRCSVVRDNTKSTNWQGEWQKWLDCYSIFIIYAIHMQLWWFKVNRIVHVQSAAVQRFFYLLSAFCLPMCWCLCVRGVCLYQTWNSNVCVFFHSPQSNWLNVSMNERMGWLNGMCEWYQGKVIVCCNLSLPINGIMANGPLDPW